MKVKYAKAIRVNPKFLRRGGAYVPDRHVREYAGGNRHVRGHNGDSINAYFARPLGVGPFPGMVLIHHAPG